MTGFGAAETAVGDRRVRAEIRTVNHRYFHATVRLPSDLAAYESECRETMKQSIGRGHASLVVSWVSAAMAPGMRVDWMAAESAVATLRELQQRLALSGDVTVEQVVRFPDVIGNGREVSSVAWEVLQPVVAAAANACVAERRREGEALSAEIGRRLVTIDAALGEAETLMPARMQREMQRLQANVRDLLGGVEAVPDRVAQELAFLADRLDVTEERVRLRAHLAAMQQAVQADGAVGKQLGFLAQEAGREINTIGSKANDAAIAHLVVTMKGELEKVREQLENLE